MDHRSIYTRVYSPRSAGDIVSGRLRSNPTLQQIRMTNADLEREFRKHDNRSVIEPTALVSVSSRIIDTLSRAFQRHHLDHEPAEDIWIIFVGVPDDNRAGRLHSAEDLANLCGLEESTKRCYEWVFEWAVPAEFLLHRVSLQTLIDRGVPVHWFADRNTVETRRFVAEFIQRAIMEVGPWKVGLALAEFAHHFGARAPLEWTALQLFSDCISVRVVALDEVELRYNHDWQKPTRVDFHFFYLRDDGFRTGLYDWWLLNWDRSSDYDDFHEWQAIVEDEIIEEQGDFSMAWHEVDYDGNTRDLLSHEVALYNRARDKLIDKHKRMRAEVEAQAVALGL